MSPTRIVAVDQLQQFTAVELLSDPGHIGGPVIVPSCVQVIFNWTTTSGRGAHNVTYGRYSGGFTPSSSIANTLHTGFSTGATWTALAAFMPTTVALAGISLRDVNAPNGALINSTTPAAPGTSASPGLPDEVALVVTMRTALAGRANRGRMYIPGWATNALAAGNVAAAATVTALQNWVQGFGTVYTASGLTLVIGQPARNAYTGSTGTQHPARPAGSVIVNALPVRDNHWDTQRRRGLR